MANDPLKQPIVILGAPRSGTSMLSQILSKHPDLYLANEPRIIWKRGNDQRSDCLQKSHATPKVKASIRSAFEKKVIESGRQRLLEKTPSNALRVPFVDAVLNDAIFVQILRPGVSSTLSIRDFWLNTTKSISSTASKRVLVQRLKEIQFRQIPHYSKELFKRLFASVFPNSKAQPQWGPRIPGLEQHVRDMDLLEVCAMQWRMCVEMGVRDGRKLPADRYTECQLDEFNREELLRIMRFCDLDIAQEVLDEFEKRFDPSQPKSRANKYDDETIKRVEELTAPTTAWLNSLEPFEMH